MATTLLTTRIWAIADTHLSFAKARDMARFGEKWRDHVERLAVAWRAAVSPDDIVLIPGDISWAPSQNKVLPDLTWLTALPGKKVLLRGNHDHWWKKIEMVRVLVEPLGFQAVSADYIEVEGVLICGTMGYIAPGDPFWENDPRKDRFERELAFLEAALQKADVVRLPGQPLIVMIHYPPFSTDGQPTPFTELITRYNATLCVYGHLHQPKEWDVARQGDYEGVRYLLVASDYLEMSPRLVLEVERSAWD